MDGSSCDYCKDGYQQTGKSPDCSVEMCADGLYRNDSGKCQPCGTNCAKCSSSSFCDVCSIGFVANPSTNFNCLDTVCLAGTYQSSDRLCMECGSHCKKCSDPTSCDVCYDSFQQETLPRISCSSTPCSTGKYRDPATGHCLSCGLNCYSCSTANVCDVCKFNFQ